MNKQIFVNLPVKNLTRSVEFFTKLGYTFDPKFTNESGTCMIVSENIFIMLLDETFFATFTKKPVADAHKSTEVLIALSVESREEVDQMVKKAVDAGGRAPNAVQDHGWMYGHGFEDPDGHVWEVIYSDVSKLPN